MSTVVSTSPYPIAVILATLSLLTTLLIIPPFVSHLRNRNLPACTLVLCVIYSNFQSFLNAVIWPHDNIAHWFSGVGLCDVENKLQVVVASMFPAAVAMVLRALARVMDTNSAKWSASTAQKKRDAAMDWACCVVIPMLQIVTGYIIQPFRGYVLGIAGCLAPGDGTWLYFLLMIVPPALWTLLAVYFAALTLHRLYRYRASFNTIMANSHTTKSRFLRLYLLCTLVILIWLPLQVIILVRNKPKELVSFAWNSTHHPTEYPWSIILRVPSKGEIPFDRWLWLIGGAAIFAFFGWGRDAVKTYRDGLKKIGLGKLWPTTTISRGASTIGGGGANTVTSKAKLLIEHGKRKMSFSTTSTSSTSNNTSTSHPSPNPNISAPTSPTQSSFLPTITETTTSSPHRTRSRPDFTLAVLPPRRPHVSSPHLYRNPSTAHRRRESSWYSALVPTFLRRSDDRFARQDSMTNDPFVLGQMSGNRDGQRSMMLSRVVAEPASPTTKRWMEMEMEAGGGERVSVKKEFRVGSESV
ncbi:hypothetical protein TI39_contig371g00014 [Zymoseptoria brevis]|uniref:Uncharacterized protein n=1 Tax=Zymoseptoria brevis TaxID=1047168 RepID=A0A0F4GSI4_9PEZI|nr:hypothetical protein TI39_contig371g00014 [Zymoseptoria brevis]